MISLPYIFSTLTTLQLAKVERSVQKQVNYDSPTLTILNGLLLGESKDEIIENSLIDASIYHKYSRPIYNSILELFQLKPITSRDNFLSKMHYAVHEENYKNEESKTRTLEQLFHELKRYGMEQESAPVLKELVYLNRVSPLKAVYKHLEEKYTHYNQNNFKAIQIFEKFNQDFSDFFSNPDSEISIKELKQSFKNIRLINSYTENNTSKSLVSLSKLILVVYCDQKQLLKENSKLTTKKLFFETLKNVNAMPFGLERFYLLNIMKQVQEYAIDFLKLNIRPIISTTPLDAPNFSFNPVTKQQSADKKKKVIVLQKDFKSLETYTIQQNSVLV